MGIVMTVAVLLIACIAVGESFFTGSLCTSKTCSSASDCPALLSACKNGKCCFKWKSPPSKNGCPENKSSWNLICPAVKLLDQCKKDEDCPSGKKCCYVGCGPRKCHNVILRL